jgi:hypothetical protein
MRPPAEGSVLQRGTHSFIWGMETPEGGEAVPNDNAGVEAGAVACSLKVESGREGKKGPLFHKKKYPT